MITIKAQKPSLDHVKTACAHRSPQEIARSVVATTCALVPMSRPSAESKSAAIRSKQQGSSMQQTSSGLGATYPITLSGST